MSDSSGIMAAASELGIDVNSLDESSDFETTEIESTEAINDETPKEGDSELALEDDSEDLATPEGEEKKDAPEQEVVQEEAPKPTAKELEEINAKSLELEAKEKAITERFAKMEKEFQEKHQEKLKAHDELDDFLTNLMERDPELYEVIKSEFQEHRKQYSNPVLDQIRQETQSLRSELNSYKEKASDEVTRTKLDAEINQVMGTLGKEAEAAGLKVDVEKIKDVWADNPKLSFEQAFHALHGAAMLKATASKAKVAATEKKIQARPTVSTAGNVKASAAPIQEKVPTDAFDAVRFFARKAVGKA